MNDEERELDFVRRQLKAAVPPWQECGLKTDLWPRMLRRMEEAPVRFGWFESVLAGLIAVSFSVSPELIPLMLYHL